jgi:hypothetical protein
MTAIQRNGLSGLALKIAAIAFAAILFGVMPRPAPATPFAAAAQATQADF